MNQNWRVFRRMHVFRQLRMFLLCTLYPSQLVLWWPSAIMVGHTWQPHCGQRDPPFFFTCWFNLWVCSNQTKPNQTPKATTTKNENKSFFCFSESCSRPQCEKNYIKQSNKRLCLNVNQINLVLQFTLYHI